jgi:hypothetical protein
MKSFRGIYTAVAAHSGAALSTYQNSAAELAKADDLFPKDRGIITPYHGALAIGMALVDSPKVAVPFVRKLLSLGRISGRGNLECRLQDGDLIKEWKKCADGLIDICASDPLAIVGRNVRFRIQNHPFEAIIEADIEPGKREFAIFGLPGASSDISLRAAKVIEAPLIAAVAEYIRRPEYRNLAPGKRRQSGFAAGALH